MSKQELSFVEIDETDPYALLKGLQRNRRFCIRSQQYFNRSTESYIASNLAYSNDLEERDRKAIFKFAAMIRMKVETNETVAGVEIDEFSRRVILQSQASRSHWDAERQAIEKEMKRVAESLPVSAWVKAQKGFSLLGLAVLVGETGDLANYSGPAKVWKRLGLACLDGVRQGSIPPNLTGNARSEAWASRGYSPLRRAEVFAFIDDVMLRAQWRGEKDEVPAHAIGPYGEVYAERKAWNLARDLKPGHAERDARRFMAKRFIRDMWVAWQETVNLPLLAKEAAD